MNLSYWEYESFFKELDFAVIGSGIVGLNAAISLKSEHPRAKVVILERGVLPAGASTRNAGFACFGSMTELLDDLEKMGEQAVWDLVSLRWQGLQYLRHALGDAALGYEHKGGFELFRAAEQATWDRCLAHRAAFNRVLKDLLGQGEVFRPADDRLNRYQFGGIAHLMHNRAEGQIHTGKMMAALLQKARSLGVEIYNGLGVQSVAELPSGVAIQCQNGWEIRTRRLIVATNGFARELLPELPVQPARNQVWLTRPLPGLPWEGCFHYDQGYVYFRNIERRVLIGGARNQDPAGETTAHFGFSQTITTALRQLLDTVVLPGQSWQLERQWSGIMGVGSEKKPVIERVGENTVVAVRLGGMGVAIGSIIGRRAAALVC